MSHFPIRRVAIDFEGVPFDWHPTRPRLGLAANAVSGAAVVFERRLCETFREALPRLDDPCLVAEVEGFIAQEATHSRLHRAHVKALVAAHPALEGLMGELDALADARLSALPLIERVAFGATVEGWLAPLGRFVVAERGRLFADSDVRVASLFLWHVCEEIEHRSTALKLYRALGGTWRGRMKAAWKTRALQRDGARLVAEYFIRAVPGATTGLPELPVGPPLAGLGWGIAASLTPRHDTGGAAMPDFAQTYLSLIRQGVGPVEAWTGRVETPRSRSIRERAIRARATRERA